MIWYFQIIGLVISMLWSHRMILSMINYRSLFNLYDMILLHNLGIFFLLWYYHSSSIIVYKKSIWMESHGIARNFDSKSIIRSSIISSFHCLSVNFYTQIYAHKKIFQSCILPWHNRLLLVCVSKLGFHQLPQHNIQNMHPICFESPPLLHAVSHVDLDMKF